MNQSLVVLKCNGKALVLTYRLVYKRQTAIQVCSHTKLSKLSIKGKNSNSVSDGFIDQLFQWVLINQHRNHPCLPGGLLTVELRASTFVECEGCFLRHKSLWEIHQSDPKIPESEKWNIINWTSLMLPEVISGMWMWSHNFLFARFGEPMSVTDVLIHTISVTSFKGKSHADQAT